MQTMFTGLSIANTRDPIETYQQLGGPGRVFNKALAIPFHLGYPWHSVEYVTIPPGHNGVGSHRQTTDEIYFILSGHGELVTNGEPVLIEAGMLVCAPAGTTHALTNASATEALSLLVVELITPERNELTEAATPSLHNVLRELRESEDGYSVLYRTQRVSSLRATVDLGTIFSASWDALSLLVLPPGCQVHACMEPDCDQLFFLMSGHATWTILTGDGCSDSTSNNDPGQTLKLNSDGPDNQCIQSVLVPRGVACSLTNHASGDYPLQMLRLTVRRTPRQAASHPSFDQSPKEIAQ